MSLLLCTLLCFVPLCFLSGATEIGSSIPFLIKFRRFHCRNGDVQHIHPCHQSSFSYRPPSSLTVSQTVLHLYVPSICLAQHACFHPYNTTASAFPSLPIATASTPTHCIIIAQVATLHALFFAQHEWHHQPRHIARHIAFVVFTSLAASACTQPDR